MQFKDNSEKSQFEFMLDHVFHHFPAGVRTTGTFAGESHPEFWWRSATEDNGFVMVWLENDTFISFHTYYYPPEIYS